MNIDYTPFFQRYEALVERAEQAFEQIKAQYPQAVTCRLGCSDCCHALFDISLIEALYLNCALATRTTAEQKERIVEAADQADRKIYRLKRQFAKQAQQGVPEDQILEAASKERIRCPLLTDQDQCDLYAKRPITCRLYGVPTAISGAGHTCGQSGFTQGGMYPTVHLDKIHNQLFQISKDLVMAIQSPVPQLAELWVPPSRALLTLYDDEFFGFKTGVEDKSHDGKEAK